MLVMVEHIEDKDIKMEKGINLPPYFNWQNRGVVYQKCGFKSYWGLYFLLKGVLKWGQEKVKINQSR